MTDDIIFDFFSSRLHFINITDDALLNIELWHYLSAFESHIYGVLLQHSRINADLAIQKADSVPGSRGPQAVLDIYYYILTWDKLKKIYEKIKSIINKLQQTNPSFPKDFKQEFRHWKKRIDHLFSEFDAGVRNEYEHPSLEPYLSGNIVMWGNILIDGSGNIKAHVGKNWFSTIKNEHCVRIQHLRTDLIDMFLKHFSEKPLTKEIIKVRDYIEKNIESIVKELKALKDGDNMDSFNEMFHTLILHDIYLSREGMSLTASTKDRLYSFLVGEAAVRK